MVEALGCDGILVREPKELQPALARAFESGRPTLVNVLTDPKVVYPASQIWLKRAKTWPKSRLLTSRRESTAIADGRSRLVPQDGQGYVFRDQSYLVGSDGGRRHDAAIA